MAAPQPDTNAPAALHPSLVDPQLTSAIDDNGNDFYLSSWNSWYYPAEVGVMPWGNLDVWEEYAHTWEELAHPNLLCVPIDTLDQAAADLMMIRVPGIDGLWQRVQTKRAMNGPLASMTADPPTQAPEPHQAPTQDSQSLAPAASSSSSTHEPSTSASLRQQSQLAIRTRRGLTQPERDHVVSRCTASPKVTRFDVAFDIVAARGGQVIDAVSMSQIAALLVQYGQGSELESRGRTDNAEERGAVVREEKEAEDEDEVKNNKKKDLVQGKEAGAGAPPQPHSAISRKRAAGHKKLTKKASSSSSQFGAAPGKAQLAHKQDKNSNAGSSEGKGRSTMTNKKRRKR